MSLAFSDLLCDEDSTSIISYSDHLPEYSNDLPEYSSPETSESIAGLLEDEADLPGISSNKTTIDASTRAQSISWILKVQRYYGFQPLTAYLSVSYFDRFLHCHNMPKMNGWPVQLLSVACLSLAAKMEEPLVPSLLDLQVEGAKFMFEPRNVQRMELLVLRVLDWRLGSVTPLSYLSYFALKVDPTGTYTGFLTSRAKQVILSTLQETSLLEYRSSCIGAASIVRAANDLPNFSFITAQQAQSWCDGLLKDNIMSCYELIRKMDLINDRPKKQPKVLPQVRVMTRTSFTSSDSCSSSSSSSSPYKRRKLNNNLWEDNDKETSDQVGKGVLKII